MNAVLVNELIDILNREAAIYESVLKLSKSKTEAIIAGKVTELESVIRLEQSMILQMGRLEDEREKLIEGLSAQLGRNASEMTISGLKSLLQGDQAERLDACRRSLDRILKELSGTNELNSKLIKNSLDYIDFSLNLLTNTGLTGNIYGNSGQTSDSKKRNFFDVKL